MGNYNASYDLYKFTYVVLWFVPYLLNNQITRKTDLVRVLVGEMKSTPTLGSHL